MHLPYYICHLTRRTTIIDAFTVLFMSYISLEEQQLLWQRRKQWLSEKSISYDAFFIILIKHCMFEKDKRML